MKVKAAIEKKFRNIDAEYTVIAYVSRKDAKYATMLKKEWFTVQSLAEIALLVKKTGVVMTKSLIIHELSKKRDLTFGREVLKATCDKLSRVSFSNLSEKGLQMLFSQLNELYESRRCLFAVSSIVSDLKNDQFDLVKTKKVFKELSETKSVTLSDRAGDYLVDFEEREQIVKGRLEKVNEEDGDAISTGIVMFDNIIGGIMPTEFGVVAGKTGIGKTAFLIHLALTAWLSGRSVFFASGEMSKELIEFRIDSNLAGIASQKFRKGDLNKSEWKRWKDKIEQLRLTQESFFEVVSFSRNFTVDELRAEITRVQSEREKRVDLVCIDYLNIMSVSNSSSGVKEWSHQSDVVWDVKSLAADLSVPIWTAGQITDEGYEAEKLELQHLKYARAISETAPIVVGLVQTEDDLLENRIQLQIMKMRNAPKLQDPIYLHPNLEIMRIHERVIKSRNLRDIDTDVVIKRKRKRKRS